MTTTNTPAQITFTMHNYPCSIETELLKRNKAGDSSWTMELVTKNPHYYRQDYAIRFNGEHITTISHAAGMGFASNSSLPMTLSADKFEKLQSLMGSSLQKM